MLEKVSKRKQFYNPNLTISRRFNICWADCIAIKGKQENIFSQSLTKNAFFMQVQTFVLFAYYVTGINNFYTSVSRNKEIFSFAKV